VGGWCWALAIKGHCLCWRAAWAASRDVHMAFPSWYFCLAAATLLHSPPPPPPAWLAGRQATERRGASQPLRRTHTPRLRATAAGTSAARSFVCGYDTQAKRRRGPTFQLPAVQAQLQAPRCPFAAGVQPWWGLHHTPSLSDFHFLSTTRTADPSHHRPLKP
jgi:hypothetical protein